MNDRFRPKADIHIGRDQGMTMLKVILLTLAILVTACSSDTITFKIHPQEVAKGFPQLLKDNNIWFKRHSDDRFEFKNNDLPKVQKLVYIATQSIIPFGRSSHYGEEMEKIMIRRLTENNIPFEIRRHENSNWIVWDDENSYTVQEIKKEAEAELMAILNAELQ